MGNDTVRYKSLDSGCIIDMQTLTAANRPQRLISSARRGRRPSAGLVVESYEVFPAGAMVMLDITFADQPFIYRSRGMVSWVVPSDEPTRPHKIGVMIFGMQKVDPDGVPYVETPPSPPIAVPVSDETAPPSTSAPSEADTITPPLELDGPPRPTRPSHQPFPFTLEEWWDGDTEQPPGPFDYRESPSDTLSPENHTLPPKPHGDDKALHGTAVGELVSLGSLSLKMANWRRSHLPNSAVERVRSPDSIPPAAPQFVAFSDERFDDDIDICVEPDFDAEQAMIAAFNQMQGLYKIRDRLTAAQFAIRLVRTLITCEAGVCLLVSTRGTGLFSAASDPKTDSAWGTAPRHAKEGLIGTVIKTGQAARAKNPTSNPSLGFQDGGLATENLLISPVSHDGFVIGVMELRNSPRENGFTTREENVLTYVGSALGEYLQASLPELETKEPNPAE